MQVPITKHLGLRLQAYHLYVEHCKGVANVTTAMHRMMSGAHNYSYTNRIRNTHSADLREIGGYLYNCHLNGQHLFETDSKDKFNKPTGKETSSAISTPRKAIFEPPPIIPIQEIDVATTPTKSIPSQEIISEPASSQDKVSNNKLMMNNEITIPINDVQPTTSRKPITFQIQRPVNKVAGTNKAFHYSIVSVKRNRGTQTDLILPKHMTINAKRFKPSRIHEALSEALREEKITKKLVTFNPSYGRSIVMVMYPTKKNVSKKKADKE